ATIRKIAAVIARTMNDRSRIWSAGVDTGAKMFGVSIGAINPLRSSSRSNRVPDDEARNASKTGRVAGPMARRALRHHTDRQDSRANGLAAYQPIGRPTAYRQSQLSPGPRPVESASSAASPSPSPITNKMYSRSPTIRPGSTVTKVGENAIA